MTGDALLLAAAGLLGMLLAPTWDAAADRRARRRAVRDLNRLCRTHRVRRVDCDPDDIDLIASAIAAQATAAGLTVDEWIDHQLWESEMSEQ